jgi:glycosyltransferase involved in cell wall biosynthesis
MLRKSGRRKNALNDNPEAAMNIKHDREGQADTVIKVSVVIPCYNHGKFLGDAVRSVLESDFKGYEIIIVNDGSTDPFTLKVFKDFEQDFSRDNGKITIIHQQNLGLPGARNSAIRLARGDYILPLDADNKIRPSYLGKAVEILDGNREIGIVYAYANLFGEKKGTWTFPAFDSKKLLLENFVEACSVFRKKIWDECDGYDPSMVIGFEDWDLWICAMEKGWKFCLIEEVLFDYRVRKNSMVAGCNIADNHRQIIKYICEKHEQTFVENLGRIISDLRERESHIQRVYAGNGWRLLMKYYRFRDRFLPEGTARRRFADVISHLPNLLVGKEGD